MPSNVNGVSLPILSVILSSPPKAGNNSTDINKNNKEYDHMLYHRLPLLIFRIFRRSTKRG